MFCPASASTLSDVQIGVFTVGDLSPNEIVALAIAAEEAGFDVFAVGEDHNPPYNSSCPATLLAHIAARTTTITLSTATTLITTNDPARIAAEYATLQLLAPRRTDSRTRPSTSAGIAIRPRTPGSVCSRTISTKAWPTALTGCS